MNNLKYKIKEYLSREDAPTYLIEKKLNLTNNLLGRILDGTVKYPSVENLIKIADGLNCSLDELVGRRKITDEFISLSAYKMDFHGENISLDIEYLRIMSEICLCLTKLLIEKKVVLTYPKFIELHEEIFKYSIESTPIKVDTRFISWIVDKHAAN